MQDAAGKPGIHPRIKIIYVHRVLAYRMGFHQVHELCELFESSKRKILLSFVGEIITCFAYVDLRRSTEDDIRRILAMKEARDFHGFI